MPKTLAKTYRPRRVTNEDDRAKFSSEYISLDEGEKFIGYALFHADPKIDEPGYYEYMEHYDPGLGKKGSSVPCAEEDCPYCEDGDRPRTRAKTLWLVTQIGDKKLKKPELKIFNVSIYSINAFTEMRKEDDNIYGQMFRVTRTDSRGNYLYTPRSDKLLKKDVATHLKDAPNFEEILTNQGKKIMERLLMQRVMNEEDEEEENGKVSKSTAKKAKAQVDEEGDEEMPDEAEDEVVAILKVTKKGKQANTLQVSHDTYGEFTLWGTEDIDVTGFDVEDSIKVSWEKDEEDDYVLQSEPEAVSGGADDGELPDEVEDGVFVIKAVDSDEETLEVENDELGLEFTLYFTEGFGVDFDELEAGQKVKISAQKDGDGDLVATEFEPVKAGKSKTKTKSGKGK